MITPNLYIDLHVLQTVPSANLNRDDTGAPKTALYGGVTRARVSSQSWKRAVRQGFKAENITAGIRTKEAAQLLIDQLMKLDGDLDEKNALEKAIEVFKAAGIKIDKKTNETGALLLVSRGQIEKLAQYALSNVDLSKKEIKKVLKSDQSLDLALFGRMVADNPELNVDASTQVAHAISTHEVVPEYDYFTALDDLQPKNNAGAAMLGSLEFNSSTLYRYANVNVNELIYNMDIDSGITGAVAFIKEFLLTMPSGKQNTFANKTLPSYVMINLRTDTPVNLVSAFEEPVRSKDGYLRKSIEKFEKEFEASGQYLDMPELNVVLSKFETNTGVRVANLSELLQRVTAGLKEAIQNEDVND
ncbi:hypothetical protein FC81_GL002056 [Liquorilactobacillus capillatus DSM 19910]|uniref:Type I-E CRISPR-associated protein Cas7/Cse4/CasC n=1 Tax=Liquorilactobacillus capillatus DSM 19910 TaxID=1423731 RepID=A0A0R1LY14_9LACO|nr:hypothetical protein FC81_GL002056 [Liquorilactobacillus capillatus DSM 19910]